MNAKKLLVKLSDEEVREQRLVGEYIGPTRFATEAEVHDQPCVLTWIREAFEDGLQGASGRTLAQHLAEARAAWEVQQADDAALVRTVAASLRAVGADVPTPLREAEEAVLLTHPVVVRALREAEDALVDALKTLRAIVDGSVHQRAGFRLVSYTVIDEAHRTLGDAPCGRCGDYHNDGICPEE
jgi:hypothetical protein